MNFLAHSYLSFRNDELLMGNMIGDFVKGNRKDDFPPQIKLGIELHRQIDFFTDTHPHTLLAKDFFRPHFGLYSGIYTDIIFDHYLANDPDYFKHDLLHDFSNYVYEVVDQYPMHWPPGFEVLFHHMKTHNWLHGYHSIQNTQRALVGITHRYKIDRDSSLLPQIFEDNYEPLKVHYKHLMTDLEVFVKNMLFSP